MASPRPAERLPLAVTAGEPAGVGVETIVAAYAAARSEGLAPFYVIGDPAMIAGRLARLGAEMPIRVVEPAEACAAFGAALPVVATRAPMRDTPGAPDPADAPAVIEAIERAVADIAAGKAAAVVTAPIQKATLYAAGFDFPGHTEFLGALAARHFPGAPAEPVMLLAGPDLSTVPVTVHIPLAEVANKLDSARIVAVGRIVAADLRRRFGIAAPRLAVAGLNPHAGEGGTIGKEDQTIIAPAIRQLLSEGIHATGPHSADTLFHAPARRAYDVVLAMYHDQALIPVKTIAFDETVNVTLGLPFVRTSPDHGTALDLAGKGLARPQSMIAAIRLAARLAAGGR